MFQGEGRRPWGWCGCGGRGTSRAEAKCGGHGGCGDTSPCSQDDRQRQWRMRWSEPVLTRREAAAMAAVVQTRAHKPIGGGHGGGGVAVALVA
jgi:hypothetical protein